MKGDVPGLMASGRAALAAARWVAARDAFGAVLLIEEDADARFGRGVARWWLGDTEHSLRDWQRAYVGFRRRHDPAQAVFAAIYLCLAYRMSLGNDAAARGWLGRATRLVDDHGLADERGVTERAGPERAGPDLAGPDLAGWLLLCRAHLAIDAGRPGTAEPWAREAHEPGPGGRRHRPGAVCPQRAGRSPR